MRIARRKLGRDQPAIRHPGNDGAFKAGAIEHLRHLLDVILEPARRLARERAAALVTERVADHAMLLCERIHGRTHPLPATLQAGNQDDRRATTAIHHQFLSGFPVFNVCWMRSSVLRSPSRLMNASRSRSSRYCSVTSVAWGRAPPPKMCASFRPINAS